VAKTYLTFGDIEGKLEVLRVECSRCQRKGRHSVAKLIREVRAPRQHDEVERAAERGLSKARCAGVHLPGSAKGAVTWPGVEACHLEAIVRIKGTPAA